MKELIVISVIILAIFTGIMSFVYALGNYLGHRECNSVYTTTSREVRWTSVMDGGCYVKVNDKFVPLDNWRGEFDQ